MAKRSERRDSGTGHSLPGASPLDPQIHMLNPSSGMHALFLTPYTIFILVFVLLEELKPHLGHINSINN